MQPPAYPLYSLVRRLIVSNLSMHKEKSGDSLGVALLKQLSPLAWQHINLYGRYEFANGSHPVKVDEIGDALVSSLCIGSLSKVTACRYESAFALRTHRDTVAASSALEKLQKITFHNEWNVDNQ